LSSAINIPHKKTRPSSNSLKTAFLSFLSKSTKSDLSGDTESAPPRLKSTRPTANSRNASLHHELPETSQVITNQDVQGSDNALISRFQQNRRAMRCVKPHGPFRPKPPYYSILVVPWFLSTFFFSHDGGLLKSLHEHASSKSSFSSLYHAVVKKTLLYWVISCAMQKTKSSMFAVQDMSHPLDATYATDYDFLPSKK